VEVARWTVRIPALAAMRNHIDIEANQLRSKRGKSLVFAVRKARLDHEVSPLDIAEFVHAMEECPP
jgi:hypothetical protein